MRLKFFLGFAFVLLGIVLQLFSASMFGGYANTVLAALIAAAFFLDLLELGLLVLVSVLIFNWQPAASLELLTLITFPLLAYAVRRMFPYALWVTNLAVTFASVLGLYLLVDFQYLLANPVIFAFDIVGSMLFGSLVFFLFSWAA